jgi:hypothetical protein
VRPPAGGKEVHKAVAHRKDASSRLSQREESVVFRGQPPSPRHAEKKGLVVAMGHGCAFVCWGRGGRKEAAQLLTLTAAARVPSQTHRASALVRTPRGGPKTRYPSQL